MLTRYARRFPAAGHWECSVCLTANTWLRLGLVRQMMIWITRFGDGYGWGLVGVGLLLFGGQRGARHVLFGSLAVALAQVVYNLAKRLLVRNRPCDSFHLSYLPVRMPDAFSFPSGHTTTAFTMAIIIGHFSAALLPAALPLALMVGFSRIALGAHFPSDVAAGILLGCLCAGACLIWY